MNMELSCKIEYLFRSNHSNQSMTSKYFTGDDLGKAPCFNFPDEFQRCLGKAAAGSTEPKDGSETVAIPQHDCLRAMGGRVAQELFQLFALSNEARRIQR